MHVSQRRDVGASCGALRLRGAAVRRGQRMENSRQTRRAGSPTIVPKVADGAQVRQANFGSVPDPSAHAPRLGCCRLRGRPRRPGRRASGRAIKLPCVADCQRAGGLAPRPARNHLGPIGAPGRKRFGHIGSIAGARGGRRFPAFMSEQACTLYEYRICRRAMHGRGYDGQDPRKNRYVRAV